MIDNKFIDQAASYEQESRLSKMSRDDLERLVMKYEVELRGSRTRIVTMESENTRLLSQIEILESRLDGINALLPALSILAQRNR